MKKIYIIFLLIFCLVNLTSCKNRDVKIYDNNNLNEFTKLFYDAINSEEIKYVACDFRSKLDYEEEHLRQFQNYDLQNGDYKEFITWLTSNYSKKHQVYLFSSSSLTDDQIQDLKKNYKQIYIYVGDYNSLKQAGEEYFIFDSGAYDCGC